MTDTPYNMPPLGLFGKRCRILTGYDKRPFVYRIVNSGLMSNTWCEPPITYQSERNPVRHDHRENVLIVVLDTLIDDNSRLIRVALKDVELMDEAPTIGGWISVKDDLPKEHPSFFARYYGTEKWAKGMWRNESDRVLVTILFPDGTRTVDKGILQDGTWKTGVSPVLPQVVTHWAMWPEPAKEEENNA